MKAQGQTASRFGILLGIVVIVLLAAIEVFAQRPGAPADSRPNVNGVVKPLAKTDTGTGERALYDGYVAALASRRWELMIAHGDAALSLALKGDAGLRHPWVDQARHSYMMALFRARAAGSVEGMTRASEAFLRLGDRDAARLALRMAWHAAPDERTAASLRDRAERLAEPQVAATR